MGEPHADRNLLFGILALQMDFLDRDGLVEALNAWVLEKDRPLERVLLDRGALDAEAVAALEAVLALHLRRHGGDPARSLAAIASPPDAREAIGRVLDDDVQASLARLGPPGDAAEGETTITFTAGNPTSSGTRFRVLRPHARGGLGEVYVARDEELGRQVALKEIQADKLGHPGLRSRFVLEAEINGNLEHPGIVPVYGLGTHPDGRPFYAMRFIRGDSLKRAIAEFHREADGRDPAATNLRLRELLDRFVDVCNAIAYAHSRGVLHRDLKPANVMLGPYGETLVVDWGLAKATGRRDPAGEGEPSAEATLVPPSGDSPEATAAGSALGTPGYLSPEQAEGRADDLGPATDVYGLGATLYALLTGRPPVVGDDVGDVLARTLRGEIPLPRSVAPGVPPALAAICLKALATRPEDRYPSARALADDVRRWLADEPVSAHREPWPRRAARWARRHRTLVTTAASVLLVLAATAATLGIWLAERRRERLDRLDRAFAAASAREALALADPADAGLWAAAVAAAGQAAEAVGDDADTVPGRGILALRDRVEAAAEAAEADRALISALTSIRTALLDLGDAGVDAGYLATFAGYGLDLGSTPLAEAAARLKARPAPFRAELVAMLDDWIAVRRRLRINPSRPIPLVDLAIALDPDPERTRFRDLLRQADLTPRLESLREMAADDGIAAMPAPTAVLLGIALIEANDPTAAIRLLRGAAARHPEDIWVHHTLAEICDRAVPRMSEEALRHYTAARALRPETGHDLAHLLADHGRSAEAAEIFADLVRRRPGLAQYLTCYGGHLKAIGRAEEAKPWIDRAVAAQREAVRLRPDDGQAHYYLGRALRFAGDKDGAIASLREAIRLEPSNVNIRVNLGLALWESGDLTPAAEALREAVRVNPLNSTARNDLGAVLMDLHDLDGAIAAFREAIRLDPDDPNARNNLGVALGETGEAAASVAAHRAALKLDPENARTYLLLANALVSAGDRNGAIAALRGAIRLDPDNPRSHHNLAKLLLEARDARGAVAAAREAVRLDPENAKAHSDLGAALGASGDPGAAIVELREAIRLDPDLPLAHSNLGDCLAETGDLDGALAAQREAIRLDPDLARGHGNLGATLAMAGDYEAAIAPLREAIRLDPEAVEAHLNLYIALDALSRHVEALPVLERAHELGSKRPGWPHPTAEWLDECRKLAELEARLNAVLAGEADGGPPVERFRLASLAADKQLYAAAARLSAEGFADLTAEGTPPGPGEHYRAARWAALASGGRDAADPPLSADDRSRWRRQALDWLRADLDDWSGSLAEAPPEMKSVIAQALRHWQSQDDFAPIRDAAALAAMPEADRDALDAFWADVAALRDRIESPSEEN